MVRTTDIHSMTDFIRNARAYVAQVKETKNPIAITVNGQAEVVVVDAAEYQALVDESESARLAAAIREAEADIAAGRVHSLSDVKAYFKEKHGI